MRDGEESIERLCIVSRSPLLRLAISATEIVRRLTIFATENDSYNGCDSRGGDESGKRKRWRWRKGKGKERREKEQREKRTKKMNEKKRKGFKRN